VDLWSLDVEGAELAVLSTFDFKKVTVNVWIVENWWVAQWAQSVQNWFGLDRMKLD
jgi:hypothetical protein